MPKFETVPVEELLKPVKEATFVVCPCCGLSRKLDKTGRYAMEREKDLHTEKGRARFDHVDPHKAPFIDWREVGLGRGRCFSRTRFLTLKQALADPGYQELIDQLRDQCIRILELIDSHDR